MSTTSGKSFKEITDLTGTTLTYGFEVLSSDDIVVVGINTAADPDVRTTLIKDTNYTLNTTTKTVTCAVASWAALDASYGCIRAYRVTTAAALVDFKSGGVLSESDLDTAYKQSLFVAQEVSEDAAGTGASGLQSVGEAALEEGSVTEGKIGENAVSATKIADDAVVAAKIADDAVTAAKVADNAVATASIVNDAVTFEKLADALVLDSDTMSGASATKLATSESIKAYVSPKPNIVQAVKTDVLIELDPQNAWTDVTGLEVTITPKFSNSKFLISSSVSASTASSSYAPIFRYVKGSTPIALALGATRGDRTPCAFTGGQYGSYHAVPAGLDYLDAQAADAGVAITFKLQWTCDTTVDIYINRTLTDTDTNTVPSPISTLTVTEIYQ